jgi:hypothetical protein
MQNPLMAKHRVPKLYCSLPSQLQFYPPDSVKTSINKEVAVYALTVRDQILLKTPDALLNGETMVQIIQSCVPDITDSSMLVEPDINALFVAIRAATNGSRWEWEGECPACKKAQSFMFNLTDMLDTQTKTENDPSVLINDEYVVRVRPFNFKQRHLSLLNEIEESKAGKVLNSQTDLDTEQQAIEITKIVQRISSRLLDLVTMSVVSVQIQSSGQVVEEEGFIKEFVLSLTKREADAISSKIKDINNSGIMNKTTLLCESCSNEWEQELDFDPTNFFD